MCIVPNIFKYYDQMFVSQLQFLGKTQENTLVVVYAFTASILRTILNDENIFLGINYQSIVPVQILFVWINTKK